MKETADEPIRKALKAFLRGKPESSDEPDLAALRFLKAEPALVREWLTVKLTALIKTHFRDAKRRGDPYRPYLFGLGGLQARLPLGDVGDTSTPVRATHRIGAMTLAQLRASYALMQSAAEARAAQPTPKMQAVAKLIDEMSPLEKKHHDLTVQLYCELQAKST